jgi:DNA-binding transcriptional ArsR family regulator
VELYYFSIDLIKQIIYNECMDKFSALADPTRRSIMEMLANSGELSASQISSNFTVSAPAISQHLKILRAAGLVTVEKRAQQRIYRVNPAAVQEMEAWMRDLRQVWNERFDALDELLRAEKNKRSNHQEENDDKPEQ